MVLINTVVTLRFHKFGKENAHFFFLEAMSGNTQEHLMVTKAENGVRNG